MSTLAALLLLTGASHALPTSEALHNFLSTRDASFEFTAWGDSYASGVGAGNYYDGRRCLRYTDSYPTKVHFDPEKKLPSAGGDLAHSAASSGKFNNVVCSGSNHQDILDYQFYTEDQYWGQPNAQFYPRKAIGNPAVGTLTVGGNNIDFPGILNNCIVEGFPYPLSSGFTQRSCDDQRALSWSLIASDDKHDTPNPKLVQDISSVIYKIQDSTKGNPDFRLYVTGYGQFFNEKDPGCNDVTFARTANPHDDGKPHTKLTTDLRADLNAMSRMLNRAVSEAVSGLIEVQGRDNHHVKYINIDGMLDGHRFCEAGVKEPDQSRKDTWLLHYPYGVDDSNNNPTISYLNSVAQNQASTLTWDPKTTLYNDYINAFWDKVDDNALNSTVHAEADLWGDVIGYRARVFHPASDFHNAIYELIIGQYLQDTLAPSACDDNPTCASFKASSH